MLLFGDIKSAICVFVVIAKWRVCSHFDLYKRVVAWYHVMTAVPDPFYCLVAKLGRFVFYLQQRLATSLLCQKSRYLSYKKYTYDIYI